ncbi:hypothetical protein VP1G_11287 [Cytospora mali]|uniref:Uncharacterized protein n=1 Tax=Cytospora mali TaxID=578113 RepID=A0A194VCQ1_CYTMA|nr:hypothetical protein VP1G_11287 [Valsa mali var. pyri (nom. inval.)]
MVSIDTDLDPSKQAISNVITKVDKLRERVEGLRGLNDRPHVLVVAGDGHGVGVVREGSLDGGAEVLGEEELADVGDGLVEHGDGAVGQDGGVGVGQQVGVRGPALVVARDDGLEGDNALVVRDLHAAEEGAVDAALGLVDAVRVLSLLDVGAEPLADDVVRASSVDRRLDTSSVGVEDVLDGREHVIVVDGRHVVVARLPLLQVGQGPAVLLGAGGDAARLAEGLDPVGAALDRPLLQAARRRAAAALRQGPRPEGRMLVARLDLSPDLLVRVVLARVGEGTGGQGQACDELGEGNHSEICFAAE